MLLFREMREARKIFTRVGYCIPKASEKLCLQKNFALADGMKILALLLFSNVLICNDLFLGDLFSLFLVSLVLNSKIWNLSVHLTQQHAKKSVVEQVTETRLLLDIVYVNLQSWSYKSLQWDAVAHTHTQ